MDKNTLSNYGWIVIAVLILSVMIALATPFGDYVKAGVLNTTNGVISTSNNALSVIDSKVIPSGCKYIDVNGIEYTNKMPDTTQTGDRYITEESEFRYNYSYYGTTNWSKDESINGWCVGITDKTKVSYSDIPAYINGKPVTDMHNAFEGCENMITAPKIPDTVLYMVDTYSECYSLKKAPELPKQLVNMYATFHNCTSLTDESELIIPNTVKNMRSTFAGCSKLTKAPVIPNGVENMYGCFAQCAKLTKAPIIPESVKDIARTFLNCKAMESTVTINAYPMSYGDCLAGTNVTTILGSCPETIKSKLL